MGISMAMLDGLGKDIINLGSQNSELPYLMSMMNMNKGDGLGGNSLIWILLLLFCRGGLGLGGAGCERAVETSNLLNVNENISSIKSAICESNVSLSNRIDAVRADTQNQIQFQSLQGALVGQKDLTSAGFNALSRELCQGVQSLKDTFGAKFDCLSHTVNEQFYATQKELCEIKCAVNSNQVAVLAAIRESESRAIIRQQEIMQAQTAAELASAKQQLFFLQNCCGDNKTSKS